MNFKTNRQFTPPRIRNHTPQTVSTNGFDESRTESRVVSYRTSQERSQDKTLKQIKDIVVNKLHSIVNQDTRDDYRQCLEKIRYISPQKLADILIQTEQRSPQQTTTYSSNQQSSCSRNGSTYAEIYNRRNKRNTQNTQEKSPSVSAYQTNKTAENRSKEKEPLQSKIDPDTVINHLAKRSEYQAFLMEIDRKKQDLVELDLQVLQLQIDVRGYNNKTLQLNWEHQDEIINLENKVKKLQGIVSQKEEQYTQLIIELDKQKKIEEDFQETFNLVMQDINQMKRAKKQHSNPSNDDEHNLKLKQLIDENKNIQTQINDMKSEQIKTKNLTGMIDLKNKQSIHVKVLVKDMASITKKREQVLSEIENIKISLQEEVVIPSSETILKTLDEELEIAKQKLAQSKIQYETSISNQQQDKKKQEEILQKQNESVQALKKELDGMRIVEEEQYLKQKDYLETLKQKLIVVQGEYDQQKITFEKEQQNQILEEQNNRQEIEYSKNELQNLLNMKHKHDEFQARLRQENQELSQRIQSLNSSQRDGMIQLEKLNQQMEVLDKQIKDRQQQIQQHKFQIDQVKETLAQLETQDFSNENQQLRDLMQENQQKKVEVQALQEQLNYVSQQVNEEEIFQLKQRKQIESKMLKMNEISENEQILINKIRVLEAQLKK